MILFLLLVVILLIGLTVAAVLGRIGGFMADPTSSQSFGGVPDGSLSADAMAELHFDQGLRGYRMNQVDDVIDALVTRVRELESEVAAQSVSGTSSVAASLAPSSAPTGASLPDTGDPSDPDDPSDSDEPDEPRGPTSAVSQSREPQE